jgi:DedD protein
VNSSTASFAQKPGPSPRAVRSNATVSRPLPMPRSLSDEEILLKKRARRRLIGAIALVTLVIVLLPMFLDKDPHPLNQEISIQIPEQSSPFSSRVAALPSAPPQGGAEAAPGAKAAEPSKAVPGEAEKQTTEAESRAAGEDKRAREQERRAEQEKRIAEERAAKVESAPKSEAKPAPKPEPKPVAKTEPKASSESSKEKSSGGEGFVVQVAALVDAEKARALRGKIGENGLRAYTEVVRTAKGDVTRVRVGPFSSKESAQKAAEELKKLGLSGVVIPRG